jgi:DNA-directed RNA polymerase specialized sigma24 family protein
LAVIGITRNDAEPDKVSHQTRHRFDALMRRLGEDGGSAERAYERLHRRVVLFFQLHLPVESEALTDIVMDRLARRVDDGTQIANLSLYALGIARLVLHEARARLARERTALSDPTLSTDEAQETSDDAEALAALELCLGRLNKRDADLILAYYNGEGAHRIAIRRELAAALNIAMNALRNRALRMREALENCVRGRLDGTEIPRARDESAKTDTSD